jgi:hypothetical protein
MKNHGLFRFMHCPPEREFHKCFVNAASGQRNNVEIGAESGMPQIQTMST